MLVQDESPPSTPSDEEIECFSVRHSSVGLVYGFKHSKRRKSIEMPSNQFAQQQNKNYLNQAISFIFNKIFDAQLEFRQTGIIIKPSDQQPNFSKEAIQKEIKNRMEYEEKLKNQIEEIEQTEEEASINEESLDDDVAKLDELKEAKARLNAIIEQSVEGDSFLTKHLTKLEALEVELEKRNNEYQAKFKAIDSQKSETSRSSSNQPTIVIEDTSINETVNLPKKRGRKPKLLVSAKQDEEQKPSTSSEEPMPKLKRMSDRLQRSSVSTQNSDTSLPAPKISLKPENMERHAASADPDVKSSTNLLEPKSTRSTRQSTVDSLVQEEKAVKSIVNSNGQEEKAAKSTVDPLIQEEKAVELKATEPTPIFKTKSPLSRHLIKKKRGRKPKILNVTTGEKSLNTVGLQEEIDVVKRRGRPPSFGIFEKGSEPKT